MTPEPPPYPEWETVHSSTGGWARTLWRTTYQGRIYRIAYLWFTRSLQDPRENFFLIEEPAMLFHQRADVPEHDLFLRVTKLQDDLPVVVMELAL